MDLIRELEWRGLVENNMAGTAAYLQEKPRNIYIGFDPTASSLTIGHLLPAKILAHALLSGHQPFALTGGATGMVGDPSGKSAERPVLSEEELRHNAECAGSQLKKILSLPDSMLQNMPSSHVHTVQFINNLDWFQNMNLLTFLRETGKHISVNYMMAKESVKTRLEQGISFTEFSYQLIQGYDFYHLYKNHDVTVQAGGSDQWGNITTGSELIRRKLGKQAFGFTCPLLTREDGTKFGKSEGQNIWLDPARTSPYRFYQFWINCTDDEAKRYIRIFTFLPEETIVALEEKHQEAPHLRALQTRLAEEVTTWIHGKNELKKAQEATSVLFGKEADSRIFNMEESLLLAALEGVEQYNIALTELQNGVEVTELLSEKTRIFSSKGEIRRLIQNGGLKINKNSVEKPDALITSSEAIHGKYLLVQKGKKNYYLIVIE